MRFFANASFLFALLGSSCFATAKRSGQCISGEGEFTYGGATEAHFSLHACMEDEDSANAFGDLYSGQSNIDKDKFHYSVHCMDIFDENTVFIGTEIKKLSKYAETYQNPETFIKSLVEGDRHTILKYEQKNHMILRERNPEYLAALVAVLEGMDVTIEQYEEYLEYEVSNERKLQSYSDDVFYKLIVPLTTTCAKNLIVEEVCGTGADFKNLANSTETAESVEEIMEEVQLDEEVLKDLVDKADIEDLDEKTAGFLRLRDDERLALLCDVTAFFICSYACGLDLIDCGGGRKLTANVEDEEGDEVQGTLALFKITMPTLGQDEEPHTIGVKLDHDFDTSCKNFRSTIDHDFFADKNVDVLTKGGVKLP